MSIFPETIEQWRCPACGCNLSGKSYNLDEDRVRCTKTWHVAAPVQRTYSLTQPDSTTRLSENGQPQLSDEDRERLRKAKDWLERATATGSRRHNPANFPNDPILGPAGNRASTQEYAEEALAALRPLLRRLASQPEQLWKPADEDETYVPAVVDRQGQPRLPQQHGEVEQ